MRTLALASASMVWHGLALAAGGTVSLPGTAVIGSDSRDVTMVFACDDTQARGQTGSLSIGFGVPAFETLAKRFDFDAFEGPDGPHKPLSAIKATTAQPLRLAASGSIAADGTTFDFAVAAAMRAEAAQLTSVHILASEVVKGGGLLRWHQGSPRQGDASILVTVLIGEADAARLKTALAPCLGGK
ncbi:hypothetical protein [Methylobacterium nodulans]|nr:hypothetical protein [Methylobacterium nodulans]